MKVQPLPDDPSGAEIVAMVDLHEDDWWLLDAGDHHTFACEPVNNDGTQPADILIGFELPVRLNHASERKTERILIDPATALDIAVNIAHTVRWLEARKRLNQ